MRGATQKCCYRKFSNDISIHAPRAGRDPAIPQVEIKEDTFQSTRPVRGATLSLSVVTAATLFQSTRPVRGATQKCCYRKFSNDISIHAPRAGRDPAIPQVEIKEDTFQSTRPVRGATLSLSVVTAATLFQSTRPVRGATPPRYYDKLYDVISIHAPRAGRDSGRGLLHVQLYDFNPRAPCGARLVHLLGFLVM